MKKIFFLLFFILISCQSPYVSKKNISDNLKKMNVKSDGKIKSK